MKLTAANYFSPEAARSYWSVSQFKSFNKCEACGLAEVRGEYQREETDSLLIGSYVDAYFSGELEEFTERHQEQMFSKRGGGLLSKFDHANDMIERVKRDPLMMAFMTGEKQKILTGELFGVPWKIKMDFYEKDGCITDLKTVKDFGDVYEEGFGRRSWIEAWGYDIQGAIYTRIEQIATGRPEPLPFYIAAVTKEKVPDIKLIQIPDHILEAALHIVEAKIERFDLIKSGDVEPIRCERCDYCKMTKTLKYPEIYEIEEAK